MLYIKQYLRYIHNIKLLKFSSLCSCCCGGGFAAARRWPCGGWLPAAVAEGDSRKNNSTRKKISCWILLLLSPAAVGASLPLANLHAGEESPRRCCPTNTTTSTTSTSVDFPVVGGMASSRCCRQATAAKQQNKKKISCWLLLRWGLRSARQCAFRGAAAGLLEHRINNTAAQQKSSFFGVGLRSARQCAFRGRRAAAARTARTAEQPEQPNSRTAEQLPPLTSASPSPVRFPSASVGFPVPKLFIIVPFYKY